MLRQTFLHVPGVGYRTEERLWRSGVESWEDVAGARGESLPRHLRSVLEEEIGRSEDALCRGKYRYFAVRLPLREHWRAWPEFRAAGGFLDIGTTGPDLGRGGGTVVGLYDGRGETSIGKDG